MRVAKPEHIPNKNLVNVNYTFTVNDLKNNLTTKFEEIHSMRYFSIPEIDILADIYNFQRIAAEEFITKKNPSENTWSICITLKKK